MKKFYLPGYYIFYDHFRILYKYKKDHPNQFIEDRIIAGSYDMPWGLIWNGGRALYSDRPFNKQKTKEIMNYFQNKDNFILLHTCTNTSINDDICQNALCNWFIQNYYRKQDKIIIASPLLKSYLKEKYSNISFVNSTTLGIIDINEVNKLTQNEVYVPYYSKNTDNNYLQQIQHPENIEILCAESCMPNCPKRIEHYRVTSEAIMGDTQALLNFECPFSDRLTGPITRRMQDRPHMVTNQRIDELANMGFTSFKISGRLLSTIEWFEIIVYYLIKPEYQGEAHSLLMQKWISTQINNLK